MPAYPNELDKIQRDKLGMVFTDRLIADFIVDRAFYYLNKTSSNINKNPKENRNLKENKKMEKPIKILEPSVGGGSFYSAVIDKLLALYPEPNDLGNHLSDVYGLDIEPAAVRLAIENISCQLREIDTGESVAEKDTMINIVRKNILTGDFLSSLPWQKELTGDFDLIIGNPPYIGEKGNKELFRELKQTDFGGRYYEKGMDYFYYFIERALELLQEEGILAFITTSYWTRADSAAKLRQAVRQQAGFLEVIDFQDLKPFADADGHNSMIFLLQKGYQGRFPRYTLTAKKRQLSQSLQQIQEQKSYLPSCQATDQNTKPASTDRQKEQPLYDTMVCDNGFTQCFTPYFIFVPQDEAGQIERIHRKSPLRLSDIARINQGLVSGADKVTKQNIRLLSEDTIVNHHIKVGDGIFVLSREEKEQLCSEMKQQPANMFPFYKNSALSAYDIGNPNQYILYFTGKEREDHPLIINHLRKFRPILERRREVVNGILPYYALNWSRDQRIFQGEKIVAPQRACRPVFARSDQDFYASADIYFINRIHGELYFLLGYLNSSMIEFYLRYMGKRKGIYYELYTKPLSEIPILDLSISSIQDIAQLAMEIEKTSCQYHKNKKLQTIDEILRKEIIKD